MEAKRTATRGPTFLPLAMSAARAAQHRSESPTRTSARVVRLHVEAADAAAAECWTALLAGCNAPVRRVLSARLRELTEATSSYVGPNSWFAVGSPHRHRVTDAEARITEAVRDGDGAEFAEAFVGYDQAVAMAVVRACPWTSSVASGDQRG